MVALGQVRWSGGHLGPQEPGELPGDRGRHDALDVLAGGQDPEPGAQALLGFPRPGGDRWGQALLTAGDPHADGGVVLVGPGRLDQLGAQVALPALVSGPRWTLVPLEYSLGTSPQNPMNWLAVANRRQSATSAASVSAPSLVMPR